MKQVIFKVTENYNLTENVKLMKLEGDTSEITKPGQFVNILIDGLYLRRPISVCDVNCNELTLIYKIVGKGTEKMAEYKKGRELDLLTGLGNGFNISDCGDTPLLIGGGVGVPPMYFLAKELMKAKKNVSVVLGFNTESEIFFENEFKKLGCQVAVTTVDGTKGTKGFVTEEMKGDYSYVFACGPEPMLKAVYNMSSTGAQFSFEERMGCGFGACMGCSCKTITGYKRICKEGPVMEKEEILWD